MTRSSFKCSSSFGSVFATLHTSWYIAATSLSKRSPHMELTTSFSVRTLSWDDLFFDLADMMVESPTVIQQ